MKTVFHPANERGHVNSGWLNSYHSFSFAMYHHPQKMNFGLLRVLNDDTVAAAMGFGRHPHDNMEIVSIPLEGALKHNDSTGREAIIQKGEVQIMSAGKGIQHSEVNASTTDPVKFLQIWVFPKERGITPRYEQKMFDAAARENKFCTVVSPVEADGGVWINQDAFFSIGQFTNAQALTYTLRDANHGVYVFLISGNAKANGIALHERDGLGIYESPALFIEAEKGSEILLIEVPMH